MKFNQLPSGIIVPSVKSPPKEHSVRKLIRETLEGLQDKLGSYEQTCHGVMGPNSIEDVGRDLAKCYEDPGAYSISTLSQVIGNFLESQGA